MSDQVQDLKQLDEMHKNGSLTDSEYEEAKRKLLDSDPQQQPTTVVQTHERSSFGSIVIGGLIIIALIALIFYFFNDMSQNSGNDTGMETAGAELTTPSGTDSLEVDVPDAAVGDIEESTSEETIAE